jgi:hypothetical protein
LAEERTASLHEAERTCREAEAAIDELQRGKDTLLRANAALTALQQEHVRGRDEVKALLVTTQVAAQEVSDVSAQVRRELLACLGAQHRRDSNSELLRLFEDSKTELVAQQASILRPIRNAQMLCCIPLLKAQRGAHDGNKLVDGNLYRSTSRETL